jgi:NAD(P)H-dependent FMN reductase
MIEIICGTNRPGCNSRKIVRVLEQLYQEHGAEYGVIDMADLPPQLFLSTAYRQKPPEFQSIQDRILQADGLHVVVPEYNGSFPGILKYFIDMLKFPESFQHRTVCYVGLSAGVNGNLRGVEQLQLVFNYRNALNLPERVFIAGVHKKLSADGSEFVDEEIIHRLRDQVEKFLVYVDKHRGMALKAIG